MGWWGGFGRRLKDFSLGLADVPAGIAGGIWDLAGAGGAILFEGDTKKAGRYWRKMGTRTEQISHVFGAAGEPSRGLEAIYGRTPIGTAGKATIDATEAAYQNVVARPLKHAYAWMALGGLRGESPTGEEIADLKRGRSMGQLNAIVSNPDLDPRNPADLAAFEDSWYYKLDSGMTDLSARVFLDPTIVGGKVTRAAKLRYLVRPVKGQEAARAYVASKRWDDIERRVIEPNLGKPEKIRPVFEHELSGHAATDMSVLMSEIPERAGRDEVMRGFMGDTEAYQAIMGRRDAISAKVARLRGEMRPVTAPQDIGFTTADEVQEALIAEVESLVPQERLLSRTDGLLAAGGREPPRTSLPARAVQALRGHKSLEYGVSSRVLQQFEQIQLGRSKVPTSTGLHTETLDDVARDAYSKYITESPLLLVGELPSTTSAERLTRFADLVIDNRAYQTKIHTHLKAALPQDVTVFRGGASLESPYVNATLSREVAREFGEINAFRVNRDKIVALGDIDEFEVILRKADLQDFSGGTAVQNRAAQSMTLRQAVVGSEWFQKSSLAAPLQVIYQVSSRQRSHALDLNDVNSDVVLSDYFLKSKLPVEEREALRAEYMRATIPEERHAIARKAENRAVQSILEDSGLTVDEALRVTGGGNRIRSLEMRRLEHSRKFANDERARMVLTDPETGHAYEVPLFVTQTPDRMPLVNLGGINTVARRIRNIRRAESVAGEAAGKAVKGIYDYGIDMPTELLDTFNYYWKASVLFRLGWPIRVVGEEQFRMLEVLGGILRSEDLVNVALPIPGARKQLFKSFEHEVGGHTYSVKGPFDEEIYRQQVGARQGIQKMMQEDTRKEMRKYGIPTGGFRSYSPTEPEYGIQWTRAVNQQIRNDPIARMALEGKPAEEISSWIRGEGHEYARRLPLRIKDPDEWAADAVAEISNLLPTRQLREKALKRNVTFDDLAKAVPDASMRPEVHGEVLAQALGTSRVTKFIGDTIEKGYEWLGSKPTDVLSRNPLFAAAYRSEVKRVLNGLPENIRLSAAEITAIEKRARKFALGQTRTWLYDLGKRSDLHGMVRFLSPFAQATQEVITTWVSAAVRDPSLIGKAALIWSTPERLGLTTKIEGETYFVLPQSVSRLILPKELEGDIGRVRFAKKSLNIALQSPTVFGAGPLVNAAVSQYARGKPDVEERLKLILPFGASKDFLDSIAPTWVRRVRAYKNDDDRSWASTKAQLAITEVVRWRQGLRDEPPTTGEIEGKAKQLFAIRTAAALLSPTQPAFDSPYWSFIDAYRARFEIDPEGAQEWFLEEYGDELFALTTSLTRSTNGVPPTLEGHAAGKKYQGLIEEFPELGGLIVGEEGQGEFSRAVWTSQLRQPRGPFTDESQRLSRTYEEFATDPDKRAGWIKYTKLMDLIDAERIRRELPSLKVKEARDLASIRKRAVAQIAEAHPTWWDDFRSFDPAAQEHRYRGLYKIAADENLGNRKAIQGLRQYLKLRDLVIRELEGREFTSLDAKANYDVQRLFDAAVGKLVEQNLEFGEMYHRYLDNDGLEVRLDERVPA